jgi:hypothetical protein
MLTNQSAWAPNFASVVLAIRSKLMRRTLFVAATTTVLVGLMAGTALAHECFVPAKTDGAGSGGEATIALQIAVNPATGELLDMVESPPDLSGVNFNQNSERLVGGFATLTFDVTVYANEIGGTTLLAFEQTEDVLAQNTVGGGAHYAGPGVSGCDGVGMDSLEACLMEALAA